MRTFDYAGGTSASAVPRVGSPELGPRQRAQLELVRTAAPGLAAFTAERPHLLDHVDRDLTGVLDDDFAHVLQAIAATRVTTGDHLARTYRCYRRQKHLANLAFLLGWLPVRHAGRVYATLAEHVLRSITEVCEEEFVAAHGRVRGGRHAIVALGKLGSRELSATSDLDLMLVYDFDAQAPVSDGPQPLTGCQYYVRLTQRLIAALTCNFGDGPMFEVDFRLRPWGQKGPIATHIETLQCYFAGEAWTYEAMALTRARVVTASPGFAPAVTEALREAIGTTATRRDVRGDVAEMRRLVQREKGSRRVWDIKCAAGGLMDIDFIVQGLALDHIEAFDETDMARRLSDSVEPESGLAVHAGSHFLRKTGLHFSGKCSDTATMVAALAHARVLATTDARTLTDAFGLYQAALHLLRIAAVLDPRKMPAALAAILARATGSADLAALEARLRETQRAVRAIIDVTVNARSANLYARSGPRRMG